MSVKPDPELLRPVPALLESPALYRGEADVPAFEVKFLLTEAEARSVEKGLRPYMALDPYADHTEGEAYHVTSVYFDTPAFDVFHRSEGYRRRKFRIRRYGTSTKVFLEEKAKSKQQVRKQRTAISDVELPALIGERAADWHGVWFAEKLLKRGLQPVCRVSYHRLALIGTTSDGPIRVTFDRSANGDVADGLDPKPVTNGKPLLTDEVITEFKFLGAMPTLFKGIVEEMRLSPQRVSKYRRCIAATALANGEASPNV